MKLYIWFLSFLLTFAPIYQANAILPLGAFAVSQTGRLAVQTAGGVILKKPAASALQSATKATVGLCLKKVLNTALCAAVTQAITSDGWKIDIENNDTTNNDVDINIYKDGDSVCPVVYSRSEYETNHSKPYGSVYDLYLYIKSTDPNFKSKSDGTYTYLSDQPFYEQPSPSSGQSISGQLKIVINYNFRFAPGATLYETSQNLYANYVVIGEPCTTKYYITDTEINNYYNNHKSSDDDINVYNYDYSKHTKIEINNKAESGDTINNKIKNDIDNNETEKKVTDNAAQKIKDKKPGYDIDKIDDEHCDKDEQGRYDRCGSDRDDDDDDTASAPSSTTPPTDTPPDDDEPPIDCSASPFHKRVCDWMDWTQEEPTKPDDEKPQIKEVEAENSNKIDMAGSCPAPYQINFSVFGHSQNNSISYQPLCDALDMLKPIFVGAGALSSMFILMGYSRPNSTGVND